MGIIRVSDQKTEKLKRFENEKGKTLAEVKGGRLILTKLGEHAGYSTRGLTLLRNGLPAY